MPRRNDRCEAIENDKCEAIENDRCEAIENDICEAIETSTRQRELIGLLGLIIRVVRFIELHDGVQVGMPGRHNRGQNTIYLRKNPSYSRKWEFAHISPRKILIKLLCDIN